MHAERFDRLTRLIYAGICDDAAFPTALRILAECFGCASSALIYADRGCPGADIALTYGPFSRPEVQARYKLYAAHDPAPQLMARLAVGEASTTSRLLTPAFLASSRFLHEFYRPLGFEETLGGPVIDVDGQTGILAVHRGTERAPFDDDELATFGRLAGHLGQALRLRRTFFVLQEDRHGLSIGFEATMHGVLVLDAGATVLHANGSARRFLARNDGLALTRTGQIRLSDPESDRRFQASIVARRRTSVLPARRKHGARPYLLRLSRDEASPARHRILSVFDPDHRPADAEQTIGAAFGLSKPAAALVAALLSGDTLATYAAVAGISRNTAKFHLQAAFMATGTSRQADLMSCAAAALHGLDHAAPDAGTPRLERT